PWNYGLTEQSIKDMDFELSYDESKSGRYPWNLDNVPIQLKTKAKPVADWQIYKHSAGPLPVSDQYRYGQDQGTAEVPAEKVTLVPYGATTLRITEFPVVR